MSVFEEMVKFITTAFPGRAYLVPCLEGPPGIGKTAAINEAAQLLKEQGKATGKVVTIIASQILPNEVSGITMPVVESKAMEIFDHYRLSSLENGDILFFDELLEADQLVLSACLTLIESRTLMSGRKLPDIMIVAATNPTVSPSMLKANIRQRFVWRSFQLDPTGCREYIRKSCGFDVGDDIARRIVSNSDEYNILTPRSLNKMARWIAEANDDEEREGIANSINSIWSNNLGSTLLEKFNEANRNPRKEFNNKLRQILIEKCNCNNPLFKGTYYSLIEQQETLEQMSMEEVLNVLKNLPEWEEIQEALMNTNIEVNPSAYDQIEF